MKNWKKFESKLYLQSETNFFSLLVFTGSQGSKNWRRARHHDATFVMKTKRHIKTIPTVFLFCLLGAPPRWRQQPLIFLFRVSPGTWSETPCRANLNSKLQPAFQIPKHLHQAGEPKNEKPPNEKSKISILEVVRRLWHHLPSLAKPGQKLSDSRN